MHPIIMELLQKGFCVNLSLDQGNVCYSLNDWWGRLTMYSYASHPNILCAWDDDQNATTINNFNDLVRLVHDLWVNSKDSSIASIQPYVKWLPHMIDLGLVEPVIESKTVYRSVTG